MNWWFSGNHKRNALQTLTDEQVMEFIQQHELARRDFDAAFAGCTPERQEYLQELLAMTSKRDKSPVLDVIDNGDLEQRRANRLMYFHGKPRKKRS